MNKDLPIISLPLLHSERQVHLNVMWIAAIEEYVGDKCRVITGGVASYGYDINLPAAEVKRIIEEMFT